MTEMVGPYRLVSRIASGGMGQTFVAERPGPAGFVQRVCVKRILTADAKDPKWIARFQKEACLSALLLHPAIVALHDFGQQGEDWWMSLELVEGCDLRALHFNLRRSGHALPMPLIVSVAIEMAKALSHAHRRRLGGGRVGVIHRDVSPSNILISYDGAVKLADFGIARVTEDERTRTKNIAGKAPYMSPEHSMGRDVDARTDLFALGIVLFELIAGVRPYEGATYLQTQLNACEGKGRDLRELAPDAPEPMVRIVESLIQSDRDRRIQSADHLLDALSAMFVPANSVRTLGNLATWVRPEGPLTEGELTEDLSQPPTRGRGS